MSDLFIPGRNPLARAMRGWPGSPNLKPGVPVKVDWSNPLARGLTAAFILDGTRKPIDIVNGILAFRKIDGYVDEVDKLGPHFRTTQTSVEYYIDGYHPELDIGDTAGGSMFVDFDRPDTSGSLVYYPINNCYGGGSDRWYTVHVEATGGGVGNLGCGLDNGTSYTSFFIPQTSAAEIGDNVKYMLTYEGGGGTNWEMYANGVNAPASKSNSSPKAPSTDHKRFCLGERADLVNNRGLTNCKFRLLLIWRGRVLGAGDYEALRRNPYQVFKPANDTPFVIGAAEAPAYNETARIDATVTVTATETFGTSYNETARVDANVTVTAKETYQAPEYSENALVSATMVVTATESFGTSFQETARIDASLLVTAVETYTPPVPAYDEKAQVEVNCTVSVAETFIGPSYNETSRIDASMLVTATESFGTAYNETARVDASMLVTANEVWAPPSYTEKALVETLCVVTVSEIFDTPSRLPEGISVLSAERIGGFIARKI